MTARVEGLTELRRAFRKMQVDLSDLKAANATVASYVAAAAAGRAPRRTGRLAGSVKGNKALSRATVRAGGAALPYAGPIHWGWPARGIEPRPFIAEAAQATESAWLPIYQTAVGRAVDAATASTR